ncbi:MAG: DUF4159 domain-containing protein [Vicinamibacterales bacterium]
MTRTFWRAAGITILALAAGATALAQRGGFRQPMSYSDNVPYDGRFVFVRMSYPTLGLGGRNSFYPPWSHDYPDGERHFMQILTAVTNLSGHVDGSSIMSFDDPEVFKNPVIYLCEPGYWSISDAQVVALRSYLQKGGFLIVDDFPSVAWSNFEEQMRRVFPQGSWLDMNELPAHPIFHAFYEVDANNIPTYYDLGGKPDFRAMFEDNDPTKRMYVIANYKNDLSEYWEFSETGLKPVDESNEAYKFGVNEFIYGITH